MNLKSTVQPQIAHNSQARSALMPSGSENQHVVRAAGVSSPRPSRPVSHSPRPPSILRPAVMERGRPLSASGSFVPGSILGAVAGGFSSRNPSLDLQGRSSSITRRNSKPVTRARTPPSHTRERTRQRLESAEQSQEAVRQRVISEDQRQQLRRYILQRGAGTPQFPPSTVNGPSLAPNSYQPLMQQVQQQPPASLLQPPTWARQNEAVSTAPRSPVLPYRAVGSNLKGAEQLSPSSLPTPPQPAGTEADPSLSPLLVRSRRAEEQEGETSPSSVAQVSSEFGVSSVEHCLSTANLNDVVTPQQPPLTPKHNLVGPGLLAPLSWALAEEKIAEEMASVLTERSLNSPQMPRRIKSKEVATPKPVASGQENEINSAVTSSNKKVAGVLSGLDVLSPEAQGSRSTNRSPESLLYTEGSSPPSGGLVSSCSFNVSPIFQGTAAVTCASSSMSSQAPRRPSWSDSMRSSESTHELSGRIRSRTTQTLERLLREDFKGQTNANCKASKVAEMRSLWEQLSSAPTSVKNRLSKVSMCSSSSVGNVSRGRHQTDRASWYRAASDKSRRLDYEREKINVNNARLMEMLRQLLGREDVFAAEHDSNSSSSEPSSPSRDSSLQSDSPDIAVQKAMLKDAKQLMKTTKMMQKAFIRVVSLEPDFLRVSKSTTATTELKEKSPHPEKSCISSCSTAAVELTLNNKLEAAKDTVSLSNSTLQALHSRTQPEEEQCEESAHQLWTWHQLSAKLAMSEGKVVEGEILPELDSSRQSRLTGVSEPAREPMPKESREPSLASDQGPEAAVATDEDQEVQGSDAASSRKSTGSDKQDDEAEDESLDSSFVASCAQATQEGMPRIETYLYQMECEEMYRPITLIVPEGMDASRKVSFSLENTQMTTTIPEGYNIGDQVQVMVPRKRAPLERNAVQAWHRGHQSFLDRNAVMDPLKHCCRVVNEEDLLNHPEYKSRYNLYMMLNGKSMSPLLPHMPEGNEDESDESFHGGMIAQAG